MVNAWAGRAGGLKKGASTAGMKVQDGLFRLRVRPPRAGISAVSRSGRVWPGPRTGWLSPGQSVIRAGLHGGKGCMDGCSSHWEETQALHPAPELPLERRHDDPSHALLPETGAQGREFRKGAEWPKAKLLVPRPQRFFVFCLN